MLLRVSLFLIRLVIFFVPIRADTVRSKTLLLQTPYQRAADITVFYKKIYIATSEVHTLFTSVAKEKSKLLLPISYLFKVNGCVLEVVHHNSKFR